MPEKDITKFTDNQIVGGLISFITVLFTVLWYFIRRTITGIEEKIKNNNVLIEDFRKQEKSDFDFIFKWTGEAFEKIAENYKHLESTLVKELDKNSNHVADLYNKINDARQILAGAMSDIENYEKDIQEIKKNCRENMEKEIEARYKKR